MLTIFTDSIEIKDISRKEFSNRIFKHILLCLSLGNEFYLQYLIKTLKQYCFVNPRFNYIYSYTYDGFFYTINSQIKKLECTTYNGVESVYLNNRRKKQNMLIH